MRLMTFSSNRWLELIGWCLFTILVNQLHSKTLKKYGFLVQKKIFNTARRCYWSETRETRRGRSPLRYFEINLGRIQFSWQAQYVFYRGKCIISWEGQKDDSSWSDLEHIEIEDHNNERCLHDDVVEVKWRFWWWFASGYNWLTWLLTLIL